VALWNRACGGQAGLNTWVDFRSARPVPMIVPTAAPGRFHLFAISLDDVTFIRYDDATGDQHVAMWPPAREFIRRGDGGTSLREPEPANDIIAVG
jgi:hypothetical protein